MATVTIHGRVDFVTSQERKTLKPILTLQVEGNDYAWIGDDGSESLPWVECCSLSSLSDIQRTFHAVVNMTSKEFIHSNFLFVHEGKRVNSVFLQSCQNLYNIKVRAIDSSSASETDKSIVNVLSRKTKSRTLSCSLFNDNHWKENDPGIVLVSSSYFYARFPPNQIQSMVTVFLPFFVLGKIKIQTEYLLMFWSQRFSVRRANTMPAFIIQIPLRIISRETTHYSFFSQIKIRL